MRLPLGPLRGPLTFAASLGEGVLEVALMVVREARDALERVEVAEHPPDAPDLDRRPARPSPKAPPPARKPPPPRAKTRPLPPEAKTMDDSPVPVAEFGEEGAEEEPGADVSVDEPWEGYRRMSAAEVKKRLESEEREVLATVVLYEGFAKKRRSVIEAAEKRLNALSPPRA
jgi:hypothetical protein